MWENDGNGVTYFVCFILLKISSEISVGLVDVVIFHPFREGIDHLNLSRCTFLRIHACHFSLTVCRYIMCVWVGNGAKNSYPQTRKLKKKKNQKKEKQIFTVEMNRKWSGNEADGYPSPFLPPTQQQASRGVVKTSDAYLCSR